MINDTIAQQLIDYLDGNLSENATKVLEAQLASDANLQKMLDDMRQLQANLAHLPLEQPDSKEMTARLQDFIQTEKKNISSEVALQPNTRMRIKEWLLAAASVVLLLGFGFGWLWKNNRQQAVQIASLQDEMRITQRMMVLATLDKPSASERIRAVNVLQKEQADPEIINALVQTMNFDDMTNVRMKATQALAKFGNDPAVKTALIHSLPQQESPEVQIAIIDALVAIGVKDAVPILREFSLDQGRKDFVRQKAASSIQKLI